MIQMTGQVFHNSYCALDEQTALSYEVQRTTSPGSEFYKKSHQMDTLVMNKR